MGRIPIVKVGANLIATVNEDLTDEDALEFGRGEAAKPPRHRMCAHGTGIYARGTTDTVTT